MSNLLWVIAVVFVVLWALSFAFHATLGGFIHAAAAAFSIARAISQPDTLCGGPNPFQVEIGWYPTAHSN